MSSSTAAEALADIVADANRMTPEQVRDIIEEADLYGAPEELDNTAVGNYVAHQALIAGVAPALYSIVMGTRLSLVNTRARTILATVDITGTLTELDALIADDNDPATRATDYAGFGHLHTGPDDDEPLGAADLAEQFGAAPVTADERDFFDRVTGYLADFAA